MTPTAAVNRNLRRLAARNVTMGLELYMRGLGLRGRASRGEVLAFRRLAESYLSRPEFRPAHGTRVLPVHEMFEGKQVRGEWVEVARPTRTSHVVLYVHGGAFVAFSPRTHRGLVAELASRTARSVFSVDYRLAPEYPFPAAADDVLRAYAWLLDSGVPASAVIVAGDSAGGHLALGLTPRAVRAGLPAPGGVVAISPVVDVSMGLSREWELAHAEAPRFAGAGRAMLGLYSASHPADDPELLLTGDDLSVMPPVLIQCSESEPLARDAEVYAEALRAAGGEVTLQTWPDRPHVFQIAWRISATASEAVDRIAEFVVDQVPEPAGPRP